MPTKEKTFITIKGYKKNPDSEIAYQRNILAHKMAQRIKESFMPKVIEFKTFERDDILWITSMSAYGGEPICPEAFFTSNDTIIDHQMINFLRHSIKVIEQSDSGNYHSPIFTPKYVQMIIRSIFGHRVISAAPEWSSAHCDFHWGNILKGGIVVDWETFSLAPKGFDAASIVLFSASNSTLFERVYRELSDILETDSGRVAILLEAGRIMYQMNDYWERYEANLREAVMMIVKPKKIRWPKKQS
jgi:hypothetical protein